MNFESLDIGSPKRVRKAPHGWDAFFPYYAGYPLSFASRLIRTSGLDPGAVVFDPWNGSGTTTFAARDQGFEAVGVDINPAMIVVARARSLHVSEADSLEPLCREIIRQAARVPRQPEDDPLSLWFTADTATALRSIERVICKLLVGRSASPQQGGVIGAISPIAATFYVGSSLPAACYLPSFKPQIQRGLRRQSRTKSAHA